MELRPWVLAATLLSSVLWY